MIDPEDAASAPTRQLKGALNVLVIAVCLALSVGHLYVAIFPELSEYTRNVLHFAGFAFLAAILYPVLPREYCKTNPVFLTADIALGLAAVASALWFVISYDRLTLPGWDFGTLDWIAGGVLVIIATELTRRVAGLVIPVLIVISLSYVTFLGPMIGGIFSFRGLSAESALWRSIFNDEALFGTIASISSTYVFLFIIFGSFLIRSGAGEFVIDLSRAIAGKLVGGPGLVAVIASGLTGTISGSAIANTASTGVITIPLMKRAGFPPKFAGGVEAASSTGGQLMPPIMGAGAFVMASFTQIPYETIVAVAALPALLYFLTVAFFVRIEAKRHQLPPMEAQGRTLWSAVKSGGASFIIPIAVLIFLLVSGFTPTYAAVIGIVAVIASSWLTQNPMGPKAVFEALVMGARNMVMTAVLLCAVGLVVNVITTAGIGNTFSLMIAEWSNGNILIAIILVALASLILGMGLPVTAAYIVLATLSAPALAGMIQDRAVVDMIAAGNLPMEAQALFMLSAPEAIPLLAEAMPRAEAQALVGALPLEVAAPLRDLVVQREVAVAALLSAHMIIFWLSQDSNVTPPVALASFTAAAIAKSKPMATGVASWKLAKGLYIVPVLFAYTPFLSGDWLAAFTVFLFGVFGTYALAGAFQGCYERVMGWPARAIGAVAGIACLWPANLTANLIGVVIVVALVALNARGARVAALT
ncbi:TRAP transporter permease [Pontivivens ytuae]|uniref:TRAP transporter fused permease subunit n=1 Tax=Pontivivens ytuae TaxID=2789856 RepID=A0A7S9QCM8_9RHOB|nr:TRAP transporter fused permease subunit [Pontivivens ytuae]QPH54393.1 TRAP transporter fused permease subunit [Pontivivens ytuae]